jgi:hypothetical protein
VAIAAGAAVLAWGLFLAIGGGAWSATIFGVRLSSRDPLRPLLLGTLLTVAGVARMRVSASRRTLTALAVAAALTAVALGVLRGALVAGGADAYGYVSQADLWTKGSVTASVPLASEATWPYAAWAITPLGYRPALQAGAMVPVYPIGLPLTMAAMRVTFGEIGPYLAVPVLGGVLVWLTFVFGRHLDGDGVGLLAAIALLASPSFLYQLMMPMSDVPAAAWWLLAVVLALKPENRPRLAASGCATALAILTRPNLVLLALPVIVLILHGSRGRADRLARMLLWGAPAASAAVAIAVTNQLWYGSPLRSGYGGLDTLYSPRYTWRNLTQFSDWIVTTQTPFILLGVFAATWLARWSLWFALAVLVSYVWYLPFDNWTYLRFLLPAYAMLLASAAAMVVGIVRRRGWPSGWLVAIAVALASFGFWRGSGAFNLAASEQRYPAAAALVRVLPANAVVIANLHSGSLRYYANRMTLRYEWIGEDEYNAALNTMHQHGHPIYALLDGEDDEVTAFKQRYGRVSDLSWMTRPMAIVNDRVFLYAVP